MEAKKKYLLSYNINNSAEWEPIDCFDNLIDARERFDKAIKNAKRYPYMENTKGLAFVERYGIVSFLIDEMVWNEEKDDYDCGEEFAFDKVLVCEVLSLNSEDGNYRKDKERRKEEEQELADKYACTTIVDDSYWDYVNPEEEDLMND